MHKQTGFTLIELIITVVIIAIISAIALPSYQNYVRRTHCEDAKATLMGAANLLERYRAQNNSYTGADLGVYGHSPVTGSAQFTIGAALTATTYTLTATPTGMLAGSGTLTLASTGLKGATGNFQIINAWSSCKGI